MKLATGFFLTTEVVVLLGTGIAMAFPGPRASMANSGPHGLSEVLYAFTRRPTPTARLSRAFRRTRRGTTTALGIAMLVGRYVPMILVLALAGSLARQGHAPPSLGTLPTLGRSSSV